MEKLIYKDIETLAAVHSTSQGSSQQYLALSLLFSSLLMDTLLFN